MFLSWDKVVYFQCRLIFASRFYCNWYPPPPVEKQALALFEIKLCGALRSLYNIIKKSLPTSMPPPKAIGGTGGPPQGGTPPGGPFPPAPPGGAPPGSWLPPPGGPAQGGPPSRGCCGGVCCGDRFGRICCLGVCCGDCLVRICCWDNWGRYGSCCWRMIHVLCSQEFLAPLDRKAQLRLLAALEAVPAR
jgi:hypothetical protein